MEGCDGYSLLAMFLLATICLTLVVQCVQVGKIGRVIEQGNAASQQRVRHLAQHAELQSALRAEKAHVQQLMRKVEILQSLLSAA